MKILTRYLFILTLALSLGSCMTMGPTKEDYNGIRSKLKKVDNILIVSGLQNSQIVARGALGSVKRYNLVPVADNCLKIFVKKLEHKWPEKNITIKNENVKNINKNTLVFTFKVGGYIDQRNNIDLSLLVKTPDGKKWINISSLGLYTYYGPNSLQTSFEWLERATANDTDRFLKKI